MHRVYISLGSNIEREKNINAALDALDKRFAPLYLSKAYDCEPIGFIGDNFLNLVAGFECGCSIAELASILNSIEDDSERVRTGPKFASRTLDLDILTYDNAIGTFDGITVPRGEITENAFVLLPLSDVAADEVHPQLNKTYRQLWQAYDQSSQQLSPIAFSWTSKSNR